MVERELRNNSLPLRSDGEYKSAVIGKETNNLHYIAFGKSLMNLFKSVHRQVI